MTKGYNASAFTKENLSIEEMKDKIKKDGSFPSLYWICQIGESVEIIDELRREEAIKALIELLNHQSEETAMLAYHYLCEAETLLSERIDCDDSDERTVNEKTLNALEKFEQDHRDNNNFHLVLEIMSTRRKFAELNR